jgi:hypothetical protein
LSGLAVGDFSQAAMSLRAFTCRVLGGHFDRSLLTRRCRGLAGAVGVAIALVAAAAPWRSVRVARASVGAATVVDLGTMGGQLRNATAISGTVVVGTANVVDGHFHADANCAAARAAGAAPLHRGDPGYRPGLDRDGDGIACE